MSRFAMSKFASSVDRDRAILAALAAAEAYAEACRRDAERYRWLRVFTGHRLQVMDRGQETAYYDTALDAAIDREREGDCDQPQSRHEICLHYSRKCAHTPHCLPGACSSAREAALVEMTRNAEELGLYDEPPKAENAVGQREAQDALRWRWWRANGMYVSVEAGSLWTRCVGIPMIPFRSKSDDPDEVTDALIARFPLDGGRGHSQVSKQECSECDGSGVIHRPHNDASYLCPICIRRSVESAQGLPSDGKLT